MSCEKHKTEIEGYELYELANKIGDLRYDKLSIFLLNLSVKLRLDAFKDYSQDRDKLGRCLESASIDIKNANSRICDSWDMSRKFMDLTDKKEKIR